MHKLVLLRHGESQWNLQNRFTGWHDVNLTEQGEREGREAGRLLKEGFAFDVAHRYLPERFVPFGSPLLRWIKCGFPFIVSGN